MPKQSQFHWRGEDKIDRDRGNSPASGRALNYGCWNWGKAEGSGNTRVNRGHMWPSDLGYDVKDVTRSVLGCRSAAAMEATCISCHVLPGSGKTEKRWSVRQRERAFWVSWFLLSSVSCLEVPRNVHLLNYLWIQMITSGNGLVGSLKTYMFHKWNLNYL